MRGKRAAARQKHVLDAEQDKALRCGHCNHYKLRHKGGECRVALNELPSCEDCAAPLVELLGKRVVAS